MPNTKYEILDTSVKDAFIKKIVQIFEGYMVYSEATSPENLYFPHFFVFQIATEVNEERKGFWWIDYLINIRYRHAKNHTTDTTELQQSLDNISHRLMAGLDTVNWFGKPHKVKMERSNEKTDGVLQCFYSIRIGARKPMEDVALQMSLELNEKLEVGLNGRRNMD